MLVALNTEIAHSHPTGMGTYARELVAAFKEKDRGVQFLALTTATSRAAGADAEPPPPWWSPCPLRQPRRALIVATLAGVALPSSVNARGIDIYHDFASARLLPIRPYIVTVHDAAVVEQPGAYPWHSRMMHRLQLPHVRNAAAVITISESAKASLIEKLGLREDRLHVIHNGVADKFFPKPPLVFQNGTRRGPSAPYLMFMGIDNARKNLKTLLRAFQHYVRKHPGSDLRLVIVGPTGFGAEATPEQIRDFGLTDRVDRLGHLPFVELRELLWGASALVFPTVSEGFGLPVLESMACGCPVLCSDIPVLREVAGNAARYVEAREPEAWVAAIEQALSLDDSARDEWIRQGIDRASGFRWSRAADAICRLYSAIGNGGL